MYLCSVYPVASYMGAWIEIVSLEKEQFIASVASYMGAWIEIRLAFVTSSASNVASYMGAWIEIRVSRYKKYTCQSHPIWVRGLKYIKVSFTGNSRKSHPIW